MTAAKAKAFLTATRIRAWSSGVVWGGCRVLVHHVGPPIESCEALSHGSGARLLYIRQEKLSAKGAAGETRASIQSVEEDDAKISLNRLLCLCRNSISRCH